MRVPLGHQIPGRRLSDVSAVSPVGVEERALSPASGSASFATQVASTVRAAPMKRTTFTALAFALVLGFTIGRFSAARFGPPADRPRVATFRGGEVGAAAVRAALVQEPAALRSGNSEVAKRVLGDLVRTRVLASLAAERGYDKDPELAQRQAEQLASLYLDKEFEGPERSKPPTDDEVRAYFEAHHGDFLRPELVRVAVIAFPGATAAERNGKRAKAGAALAEVRRREKDYYAFGDLARRRSEDPKTASRQGELPFMTREELAAATAPEVATAAFGMAGPGKVHPAVIEAASGLFVLKLLGHEPARDSKFEDLRDTLRARLASERRAEHRKAFLDRIWKEAEVHVDESALREVVAEARAGRK